MSPILEESAIFRQEIKMAEREGFEPSSQLEAKSLENADLFER